MRTVFMLLLAYLASTSCYKITAKDYFKLPVIHMNDFHARFEETNDSGGTCKSDNCIGGFSRIYNQINQLLEDSPNAVLLNAGDNFQGTLWYTLFKWNVTQNFFNKLPFDAITLGNHEFDDGIDGVVPFIKGLKFPTVVANIDDSEEPDFQNIYTKSVVVEKGGKKIGIIGVITNTTRDISNPGKLKFLPESASVNAEAERLVAEDDVFTIIVLSHCGYDVEQEMAKNASSKIGLIVGGHSHTFLYTGEPVPGPDTVRGPYPTIVDRKDGKKVLVTQASALCKYLGNITVYYGEDGEMVDWEGDPIFLDNALPQDEGINQDLKPWKEEVDALGNKIVGSTLVTLEKGNCYSGECLLGNFVTDAFVYNFVDKAEENSWSYAAIAVMNAGGLRTNIQKGNITYNDMITAQPFGNTVDVSEIKGADLKAVFELSTAEYHSGKVDASISMLQVSGVRVVYDLTRPEGDRITSLKLRCNDCDVPTYSEVDLDKTYRIITPSFLTEGGDGYDIFIDVLKNTQIGELDIDVFQKYLTERSPVYEEIEGRIEIIGKENIVIKYHYD